MNLPRISYLTDGPAAPDRSLDTAAAPARAMARVGSVLQSMGEQGFRIAEQVRETKEAGARSEFLAEVEKESADFNNALLTRADYGQWSSDYQEMVGRWKSKAQELGLSREGRGVLDRQLLDFTTKRGIQLEADVAVRTVREGRGRTGLAIRQHAQQGDWDAVERNLNELQRQGATKEEVAEARAQAQQEARKAELTREIKSNAAAAKVKLADPKFRESIPEADRKDLDNLVRVESPRQAMDAVDKFHNGVEGRPIRSVADLDRELPNLDPKLRKIMVGSLEHTIDAEENERRQTPAYRHQVTGEVAELLDGLNPQGKDFGERFHKISSLIGTLPEGPAKDRLGWRVDQVRQGKPEIWMHPADEYRARLKEDFQAGVFGPLTTRVTAEHLLNAGLLKDAKKLELAGFSPEEAQDLANEPDSWKQLLKFQDRYPWRRRFNYTEEFDKKSFELLAGKNDKRGFFEHPDAAKRDAAWEKYGGANTEFENWLSGNPNATVTEIKTKYYEVKKPGGATNARKQILDPLKKEKPAADEKEAEAVKVEEDAGSRGEMADDEDEVLFQKPQQLPPK